MMKIYGRSRLSEFLGDRVIYRNLEPCDPNIPSLSALRARVGLAEGVIPRKNEPEYARVVAAMINHTAKAEIRRLLFVGDTRHLDVNAFHNICIAGNWPGAVFIGSENDAALKIQISALDAARTIFEANRWSALTQFAAWCIQNGFIADQHTAVLVDLDKTAVGARGRNGQVIDRMRQNAVRQTVAGLLGEEFNLTAFQQAHTQLSQAEFHGFTGDNQDYLAYLCLVLGGGLVDLETLVAQIRSGESGSFSEWIARVDGQKDRLALPLRQIHNTIFTYVQMGDPTPFKDFRRNEYRNTILAMGCAPDPVEVDALLDSEILITQEVRAAALDWQSQGALTFGLSDKPDEAARPTPELAVQGWVALHQAETHCVGDE